ncbi:amidase [Romeria aff. gracilis LEGE 07310]|uniref:Amidase n=1 Tax=Vasconcelosia minhoensis LEGE 07310 TaxID=915328 RepID=A0A8J7AGZ4_9CYAN|nr:amidase family protein [Romeria gracilis]MBE9078956.1 amidase [Romeria aff. gracilis LEGE 07310]
MSFAKRAAIAIATPVAVYATIPNAARAAVFRLQEATVSDINKAFDAGALSSESLIQLYLNRIETYDDELNSIIRVNPNALETARALDLERQIKGPRSPLHGIPVILKDNYDTFDLPTTAGSVVLKGSIPPDDAFTVKQFRDAGAIILAKANMSEFASGVPGGSLQGLTRNPYELDRSPSGSSGGTGASIAANFGVIGTGSDTGGSIRGPAAANGLVGVKPTLGLTSRDGIIPLALSFDVGGPLARTVEDAAIALGTMAGIDPSDPATLDSASKTFDDYTPFLDKDALNGARIGVARDFFGRNPEVDQIITDAIATLEQSGAEIVDALFFPEEVIEDKGTIYTRIRWPEFKAQIPDYLATIGDEYPKTLAEIIEVAEQDDFFETYSTRLDLFRVEQDSVPLTDPDYIDALTNGRALVRNSALNLLERNNLDALIYPTSGCPASPLPGLEDPTYICEPGPSPTNIANISGFPDVQVPAGFTSDELPVSLSFFGKAYSEPTLLGLAYAFEQATQVRMPPLLFPALAGEVIEYEPVPEPGAAAALIGLGTVLVGFKFTKRRQWLNRRSG